MDFTTTVLNTCQDSQKELNSDYKNHACRSKTNFNETEFRGKNNISNSVDIETDHNNSYGSSCAGIVNFQIFYLSFISLSDWSKPEA